MIFLDFPEVLAGDLVNNLMEQIRPFNPGFTLGERAETLDKLEDGTFVVTTNKGTQHHAPVVAIAGGLGSFEPRKPPIENIGNFEDKGVSYFIKDPKCTATVMWSLQVVGIQRWIGQFTYLMWLQMWLWCIDEKNFVGHWIP